MKFLRHRRGLSNVVTAAMLLTGVVIMGTGIVSWSKSNLSAFQISLANTSVNATNKINENLSIENVAFCKACRIPTYTVIEVTLTNTGTLPIQATQIQINSTVIQTYLGAASLPAVIYPQQSYLVEPILPNVPPQMVWGSGKPSTIAVTTARGSIFTTQAAAP